MSSCWKRILDIAKHCHGLTSVRSKHCFVNTVAKYCIISLCIVHDQCSSWSDPLFPDWATQIWKISQHCSAVNDRRCASHRVTAHRHLMTRWLKCDFITSAWIIFVWFRMLQRMQTLLFLTRLCSFHYRHFFPYIQQEITREEKPFRQFQRSNNCIDTRWRTKNKRRDSSLGAA